VISTHCLDGLLDGLSETAGGSGDAGASIWISGVSSAPTKTSWDG